MWKWLQERFFRQPKPIEPPRFEPVVPGKGADRLNLDALSHSVVQILKIDFSEESAREANSELVWSTLDQLGRDIVYIRTKANGYPQNPIRGDVWMAGANCAHLANVLYEHAHKYNWLSCEARASQCWAQATLAVCSHYHHLVGPAMLAMADCQERLGNVDVARQMYSSVFNDFIPLTELRNLENEEPADEDCQALGSLRAAIDRLTAIGTGTIDTLTLERVRRQVTEILNRRRESDSTA